MAWDDTKTTTNTIEATDWNDLVTYLKAIGAGYQGYTGVGATWLQGDAGATGIGTQGATGLRGATGSGAGDQGATGIQGPAGAGMAWVNVVADYLAAGDGSTDDSAALASANNEVKTNGGTIYFPQQANNTFRVSSAAAH